MLQGSAFSLYRYVWDPREWIVLEVQVYKKNFWKITIWSQTLTNTIMLYPRSVVKGLITMYI